MPVIPPSSKIPLAKGSAFPGSPTTNDLFFRTDRAVMYYYDGTRWLSVQEYAIPTTPYVDFEGHNGFSVTKSFEYFGPIPDTHGQSTIYLTKWSVTWWVTSPNSGADDWTITLQDGVAGAIDSFSTDSLGADQYVQTTESLNSVRTVATDDFYRIGATKVGSAGNIFLYNPIIYYRLIG